MQHIMLNLLFLPFQSISQRHKHICIVSQSFLASISAAWVKMKITSHGLLLKIWTGQPSYRYSGNVYLHYKFICLLNQQHDIGKFILQTFVYLFIVACGHVFTKEDKHLKCSKWYGLTKLRLMHTKQYAQLWNKYSTFSRYLSGKFVKIWY